MVVRTNESIHHVVMTEFLKTMQDVDAIMYCTTLNAYDMRRLCYLAGYLSDVYGHPYGEIINDFMVYVSGNLYGYMRSRKRRRVSD